MEPCHPDPSSTITSDETLLHTTPIIVVTTPSTAQTVETIKPTESIEPPSPTPRATESIQDTQVQSTPSTPRSTQSIEDTKIQSTPPTPSSTETHSHKPHESSILPSPPLEESLQHFVIMPPTQDDSFQEFDPKHTTISPPHQDPTIPSSSSQGHTPSISTHDPLETLDPITPSYKPLSPDAMNLDPIISPNSSLDPLLLTLLDQDATTPSSPSHDPPLLPISPIPTLCLYPLNPLTFIHGGLLAEEKQRIYTNTPLPPNNGLALFFQNNKNPVLDRLLKRMNYQGKGLGLHEQGIIEPIQAKEHLYT